MVAGFSDGVEEECAVPATARNDFLVVENSILMRHDGVNGAGSRLHERVTSLRVNRATMC